MPMLVVVTQVPINIYHQKKDTPTINQIKHLKMSKNLSKYHFLAHPLLHHHDHKDLQHHKDQTNLQQMTWVFLFVGFHWKTIIFYIFQHVHEPGMPFDFQYNVNDIETQNDYSHKAVSDGDVTRGEYRVQMPDGRTQIVKYTADWKNGYNAEVSYEGEAKFPDQPTGAASSFDGYKY
jgi:hypothetical protein